MLVLWAMSFAAALSGCGGDDGPPRYNVSGSVSFAGQPLKAGKIYFVPIAPNEGPAGYAMIVDGKFDTATDGQGHVGGELRARITPEVAPPGDDPDAPVELPFGGEYQEEITLPEEPSTKDFEIPAEYTYDPDPAQNAGGP
jgi:hypothetical protein